MLKGIVTSHIPATNTRGARIKAFNGSHSVICPYDFALDYPENHLSAAKELAKDAPLVGGRIPNGDFAWFPVQD